MAPINPKKTPQTRPASTGSERRDAGPTREKDRRDAGPTREKDRRDAGPTSPTSLISPASEAPPRQPETVDPFKQRAIPDLDLYLFNMGEHRRAHRFLGAHLVEGGVRFAVWAPNAQRVSVVGSFNNWNATPTPMERRGSTGVWERFIPDLRPRALLQVRRAEGRKDAGSFAAIPSPGRCKTTANRTPIFGETYYEFKHPKVPLADKFGGALNVYEVHPLSWRFKDGRPLSYLELIDELVPYVKYMEYTHVELMGILEHPYVPVVGIPGDRLLRPDLAAGIADRLQTACRCLSSRGHRRHPRRGAGPLPHRRDRPGLLRQRRAISSSAPFPIARHTPWGTSYFDFARNEVKSFLISSLFHWIEEYYIDGFRLDAAGQFHYYEFATEEKYKAFLQKHGNCHNPEGFRFMQSMCWAVKEEHPETMLIAEDSTIAAGVTRPVEHGGHGFDFKWDLGCTSHMMKFFRAPYSQRGAVYGDLTYPMLYHHTENFLLPLGHDEVVHMKRTMVNKTEDLSDFEKFANVRLLYLLQFGYPQKKLLFMGQEFGQKSEWNAEKPLPWASTWDHLHRSLQWFVKRLNEVYKYIPAMHEGDNIPNGFEWIECQNYRQLILAFIRYDRDYRDRMVYLMNLSKEHFPEFRLGVPFGGQILQGDRHRRQRVRRQRPQLDQRVRGGASRRVSPSAQFLHEPASLTWDDFPLHSQLRRVQRGLRRAGGVSPLILAGMKNQGADAPRSPALVMSAPLCYNDRGRGFGRMFRHAHRQRIGRNHFDRR